MKFRMPTKRAAFSELFQTELLLKEVAHVKTAENLKSALQFANAAGEKKLPLVIGRAQNPRCFKGVKDPILPCAIPYRSNAKAWMNRTIWTEWLTQWNAQLAEKERKILLLLDNASPHDPVLKERLTNITLIYLPKNSSSRLQPLDAGIIKNFKVKHRQLLLKHVLARIDSTDSSASSISKQVDVLTAIRRAKKAWSLVKDSTIVNCGVPPSDVETDNPFADLVDEETEELASLQELVRRIDLTVFSVEYSASHVQTGGTVVFASVCILFEGK